MTRIGLHCVRGDIPDMECRRCATDSLHPCMLSPDLLEMLRQKRNPSVVFSPTRLLGCHRRQVLEGLVDYFTDVDDAYPLLRGNLMHATAEDLRYPGADKIYREVQLWTTVDTKYGTQRFESTPDVVVVTGECVKVIDYKSKSDVGHDLTAALPAHVAQVNMYAWLVEKAMGLHVTELEIQYLGANKPRRFTSAGPLQARGKLLTRNPRSYDTLTLEAIPLLPLSKIERGVIREIENRLAPREGLPAMLPEEDAWMCARCDVRQACFAARDKELAHE